MSTMTEPLIAGRPRTAALHNSSMDEDDENSLPTLMIQQLDTNERVGLDRIDQTSLPLDGQYTYRWDGTGVTVFVLDTGLRLSHLDFAGRDVSLLPVCGFDFYRNRPREQDNPPCWDHQNHGTFVAGIIGGQRSGVAKNVSLVAVKVIGRYGFGSDAAVYAGLDYVLGQARQDGPSSVRRRPMVANLSLGGLVSWQYNRIVQKLVNAGVVVVAAAGNRRIRACLSSPASARSAITVGAASYSKYWKRDRRAGFSNHGKCVDIFAYVRYEG
jgi:subtilisin family serine protease